MITKTHIIFVLIAYSLQELIKHENDKLIQHQTLK